MSLAFLHEQRAFKLYTEKYEVCHMYDSVSTTWSKMANVNTFGDPTQRYINCSSVADKKNFLDVDKKDFNETLLPFSNHPLWIDLDEHTKSKVLSHGWIMYNRKTIFIECDIVTPACEILLKTPPVELNKSDLQNCIAEALLDEALHTKMSIAGCNLVSDFRGLEKIQYPQFKLIRGLKDMLATVNSEWERNLIRLTAACVSETLITDYLSLLSNDSEIQSICREITNAHAADELLHSSLFSQLMCDLLQMLTPAEKRIVTKTIPEIAKLFSDNELLVWRKILGCCNIKSFNTIIDDLENSKEKTIKTEGVGRFISRCGIDPDFLEMPDISCIVF